MPLKAEVLGESHEGASWPVRQQRVHQTLCSKFARRGCSMERVELNQARVCIVRLGGVSCAWTTGGAGYWTRISAGLLHRCSSSRVVVIGALRSFDYVQSELRRNYVKLRSNWITAKYVISTLVGWNLGLALQRKQPFVTFPN